MKPLKLDTDKQVFFYEHDFYVLSNFSAFMVHWEGKLFQTAEHAYHWTRFFGAGGVADLHCDMIRSSLSAHEAFKYAQKYKADQRGDWDEVKVVVMRDLIREKADQHEYVRRKLLETGDRELIENSWRDAFWGWGPNRDGMNTLGHLWMEVRAELAAKADSDAEQADYARSQRA